MEDSNLTMYKTNDIALLVIISLILPKVSKIYTILSIPTARFLVTAGGITRNFHNFGPGQPSFTVGVIARIVMCGFVRNVFKEKVDVPMTLPIGK